MMKIYTPTENISERTYSAYFKALADFFAGETAVTDKFTVTHTAAETVADEKITLTPKAENLAGSYIEITVPSTNIVFKFCYASSSASVQSFAHNSYCKDIKIYLGHTPQNLFIGFNNIDSFVVVTSSVNPDTNEITPMIFTANSSYITGWSSGENVNSVSLSSSSYRTENLNNGLTVTLVPFFANGERISDWYYAESGIRFGSGVYKLGGSEYVCPLGNNIYIKM